jgi:peptide/nickel transport system permease protein
MAMSESISGGRTRPLLPPSNARRWGAGARVGLALLVACVLVGLLAPLLSGDITVIDTAQRLQPPSAEHWFGTDHLGRDILARTLAGTRTSLIVGGVVGVVVMVAGVLIGLYAGHSRIGDHAVMRLMDGLMAVPAVLLAIALAALLGGGLGTLIFAIAVPEVPRMARLTRGVVLALKEQLFVTAAVAVGASAPHILFRHILPNAVGPLAVQASYICAAAIIMEAVLSFLGVGTPPELPSWGNIMATGKQYFQLAPWIIAFPGLFLSALVLSFNLLGDALRDRLAPHLVRRTGL